MEPWVKTGTEERCHAREIFFEIVDGEDRNELGKEKRCKRGGAGDEEEARTEDGAKGDLQLPPCHISVTFFGPSGIRAALRDQQVPMRRQGGGR